MSKWLMLSVFVLWGGSVLMAQQRKLEIRGTGSSLYLEHTVTPKENFYSIGRMFNISAKELATYNHLHFASGLNIGQVLKIPLTKNNFTQEEVAEASQALVPIYHTVTAGETLYRLGVNYNKVSLVSLKKWNELSSDGLAVGKPLIVGFLKVDKAQSPLTEQAASTVPEEPQAPATIEQKPAEPQKQAPENSAQETPTVQTQATQPVETEQTKPVPPPPPASTTPSAASSMPSSSTSIASANGTDDASGYFRNLYTRQSGTGTEMTKNGPAGVFKSTSGWQDAKYYCFSNDASAGTVVRITDNATGKSVYAKVLDAIPDISQNDGLLIVISNAAAEKLGTGDNKFDCTISYARQ